MTINQQLHNSATHKAGKDGACPVCVARVAVDTEVWYDVEYSIAGADDWYTSNNRADTVPAAMALMANLKSVADNLEFRVVEKTLTTAVICVRDEAVTPCGD